MITDYILIIGAMKSGTTTLFDQLAADPRIAGARPKEPGFFAFEEVHAMGWDWYEGLFRFEAGQHRYALEGSTDYTKAPFVTGVAERLEGAAPRRFKLIYVLRDPVDRLISHARHTQANGREVGRFASPRRRHDLDAPGGLSPVNLAVSRYADQLAPYAGYAERGELAIVTTDEMASDGQAVMDRLSDFLDLPDLLWRSGSNRSNAAADKTRPNPLVAAAGQASLVNRIGKAVLPKAAREAIKDATRQPVEVEGRFALTPDERRDLRARYRDQVDQLAARYGLAIPAGWLGGGDAP